MFKGDKLIYISHQHRSGVSNTTNKPYEFANVKLSDGLESFELNIDLAIVPMFSQFKRGDAVVVTLDIGDGYGNRVNFVVSDISLKQDKHKAS